MIKNGWISKDSLGSSDGSRCKDTGCSGGDTAGAAHSVEPAVAGNRQEPRPLPSGRGRSPALLGAAAATQSQLQTQASLHCRWPGKHPCPCSLEVPTPAPWPLPTPRAHSDFQPKLKPSPGAVATRPCVCVLGAVLIHQSPNTSVPSGLWVQTEQEGHTRGAEGLSILGIHWYTQEQRRPSADSRRNKTSK